MTHRNRIITVLLAIAAVTMLPGTALPEFATHSLYIGAFGGYNYKPGDWRLGSSPGVFFDCAPLNPASSAMAGLRLGFHFTPQLIGEIGAAYLPLHSEIKEIGRTGKRNTVWQGDIDLYYHLLRGDVSPFIGIGASRFQSQADGDLGFDYSPAGHVSLGIRGLIASKIALRAEIRDYAVENYSSSGVGQLLQATGGIDIYLLGGRKEARGPVAVVPAVPELVSPADGDSAQPLSPVLTWNSSAGATSYTVQVSTDAAFDSPLLKRVQNATSLESAALSQATLYYWRVSASSAAGTSDWSSIWSFSTVAPAALTPPPVEPPTLVAPADGATMQSLYPALIWNGVAGATSYTVQVAADPSFASPLLSQANSSTCFSSITGLSNGTTYYWRAMTLTATQNSAWSAVWNFTTMPLAVEKFTGAIRGIHFKSSSAMILPVSFPILDSAVTIFKRYESLQIHIDGHADSTWTPEFNQTLSEDRAASVKNYLVANGIESSRITTAGHGSTIPIESNATPAGRAANRRIEFSITDQKSALRQ